MMPAEVKVEYDVRELANLLGIKGPIAADLLRRLDNIATAQERRAPVDTGRMKDSIEVSDIGIGPDGIQGDVGPTATDENGFPYPLAVEMGWTDQAGVWHQPRPFIRPSIDAGKL